MEDRHVNDLWEDMDRLNSLYEELMWGHDDVLEFVPDYENDLGETIYKSHLNVNVAPAAALEFQHFKDTIIEKINSYFGYKAINDLRIQQNYLPRDEDFNKNKSKMMPVSLEESELISNEIESLQNNSIDFYASVKSLYLQNRAQKISNAPLADKEQDDSDWEEIDNQ